MIETKITPERVPEDSPDRCQGNISIGQCNFRKTEGSNYCNMHGGHTAIVAQRKQNIYNLHRTDYLKRLQEKIGHYSSAENKYNLSEELGVARIVLEAILDKCENANDLIRNIHSINTTVLAIQKLVTDTLKVDQKIGTLMTREQVLGIAQTLINVVAQHIDDPEELAQIANEFQESVIDTNFST